MRETKEIKLERSGYVAHVFTYWTYKESTELARVILGNSIVSSGSDVSISGSAGLDYNAKMLELGVQKLTDETGKDITDIKKSLDELPETDVKLVLDYLLNRDKDVKKN
jgi:hypothetical protein